MMTFRQQVYAVMNEKENTPFGFLGFFLYILSVLYGLGVKIRTILYDSGFLDQKRLPCRVISIGNISVGGTGKTPMTIYVAQMIRDLGYRVVVISRGYKGTMEKEGGIVSNGQSCLAGPAKAGDEPFMMAQVLKDIPVMVGKNRFESGMRALNSFSADVIILDDGFQHRRLNRDIDLALIDDQVFFGNGHLVPRGILRETVSGLSRAHACVITRSKPDSFGHRTMLEKMLPGKPVFRAFHVPYIHGVIREKNIYAADPAGSRNATDFSFLLNANAFIFSGIAKNQEFRDTVESKIKGITGFLEYPDHHLYSRQDLQDIFERAKQSMADIILTTEKDFSRIGNLWSCPIELVVIGVKISFENEKERFCNFIRHGLKLGADNNSLGKKDHEAV